MEYYFSDSTSIFFSFDITFSSCCSRPSEDRTIPLSVIAERTKLSISDVEYLLMKSLSVTSFPFPPLISYILFSLRYYFHFCGILLWYGPWIFLESSNLLCFMLPIFLNEFVHWKLNVCLHGLWFWNSKSNMQYNVLWLSSQHLC